MPVRRRCRLRFPIRSDTKPAISACGVRRSAAITGYGFVRNITQSPAAVNTTIVPILLTACSVGYAVWVIVRLRHDARPRFRRGTERETSRKRGKEIIGRSHVVMTHRSQSVPLPQTQTSTPSQEGKSVGNSDIFAPASVPEHPRQIPPEELDEVFGDVPEGEANEPLEIDYPLYETSFPDAEAEEDENDTEDLPLRGRMLARGVSFEDMGEVYRHVVQQSPIITTEQKEKAGRILLNRKYPFYYIFFRGIRKYMG